MRRRGFITGVAGALALSPVAARAIEAAAPGPTTAPSDAGAVTRDTPRPTTADAVGWLGHAPPRTPRRRDDDQETP